MQVGFHVISSVLISLGLATSWGCDESSPTPAPKFHKAAPAVAAATKDSFGGGSSVDTQASSAQNSSNNSTSSGFAKSETRFGYEFVNCKEEIILSWENHQAYLKRKIDEAKADPSSGQPAPELTSCHDQGGLWNSHKKTCLSVGSSNYDCSWKNIDEKFGYLVALKDRTSEKPNCAYNDEALYIQTMVEEPGFVNKFTANGVECLDKSTRVLIVHRFLKNAPALYQSGTEEQKVSIVLSRFE